MKQQLNLKCSAPIRSGYTLVELVVGVAASVILTAGLSSSLYISAYAVRNRENTAKQQRAVKDVLGRLTRDVQSAKEITELTTNAITFSVGDRNGDGVDDVLRYSWSGVTGDPLMYSFNGDLPTPVADNVESFDMEYVTRDFESAHVGEILFISGGTRDDKSGDVTPTKNESLRIEKLEEWSYKVTLLSQQDDVSKVDSLAADAKVAFISNDVVLPDLPFVVTTKEIGIVSEQAEFLSILGFGSAFSLKTTESMKVVDNNHLITEGFDQDEDLRLAKDEQPLVFAQSRPANGVLGEVEEGASLIALDAGGQAYDESTSSTRRVMLPWSTNRFDFKALTADGSLILQRSIEWAMEPYALQDEPVTADSWFRSFLQ